MTLFADDAESLIRCSPGDDATNGFFVCLFVRDTGTSEEVQGTTMKRTLETAGLEDSQSVGPKKRNKKKKKKTGSMTVFS